MESERRHEARQVPSWLIFDVGQNMTAITGSSNLFEEPDRILPAGPPHTYFGIAQAMYPGVRQLASASPVYPLALCLVAAHALECALKAYLSRDGVDSALREPALRHNLERLWREAAANGLKIASTPPEWVVCLSGLHDRPYYLRYSTGVHGIVSPGIEPMTTDLSNLVETVRAQIR